ncbi:hypothetical protein [Streptomyces muensis]|uniref:Uncharacterized protein n=1 Tax=Streptomyces muensis TaxID=1077944 RepID=A0A9X1Q688_STRM4|nr:hypothetical protein [Streptomyces muensis]MCF1598668.1 hypothetical protein [Streptomyces muensis]
MLKNSRSKIALWAILGVVFTGGAVSLLVLALASGSDDEPHGRGNASTSWYTTSPPETSEPPVGEPSDPGDPGQSATPVTVVTQTVVAVPGGSGGDGPGSLITAFGSLLSGAAAVGTLFHAVHLSRQNRTASS